MLSHFIIIVATLALPVDCMVLNCFRTSESGTPIEAVDEMLSGKKGLLEMIARAEKINLSKKPIDFVNIIEGLKKLKPVAMNAPNRFQCNGEEVEKMANMYETVLSNTKGCDPLIISSNNLIRQFARMQDQYRETCLQRLKEQFKYNSDLDPVLLQAMRNMVDSKSSPDLRLAGDLFAKRIHLKDPEHDPFVWTTMMIFFFRYGFKRGMIPQFGWMVDRKPTQLNNLRGLDPETGYYTLRPEWAGQLYDRVVLEVCASLIAEPAITDTLTLIAKLMNAVRWPDLYVIDENQHLGSLVLADQICHSLRDTNLRNKVVENVSKSVICREPDSTSVETYRIDFYREIKSNEFDEVNRMLIDPMNADETLLELILKGRDKLKIKEGSPNIIEGPKREILEQLSRLEPVAKGMPNGFKCDNEEIKIIGDMTDLILTHSKDDPIAIPSSFKRLNKCIIDLQRHFARTCFRRAADDLKSLSEHDYNYYYKKAVFMPNFSQVTSYSKHEGREHLTPLEVGLGLAGSLMNGREEIADPIQEKELWLRIMSSVHSESKYDRWKIDQVLEEILKFCEIFSEPENNQLVKISKKAAKIASKLLWPKFGREDFVPKIEDHNLSTMFHQLTLSLPACNYLRTYIDQNPDIVDNPK